MRIGILLRWILAILVFVILSVVLLPGNRATPVGGPRWQQEIG